MWFKLAIKDLNTTKLLELANDTLLEKRGKQNLKIKSKNPRLVVLKLSEPEDCFGGMSEVHMPGSHPPQFSFCAFGRVPGTCDLSIPPYIPPPNFHTHQNLSSMDADYYSIIVQTVISTVQYRPLSFLICQKKIHFIVIKRNKLCTCQL